MQLNQLPSQWGSANRKWPALVWALALLTVTGLLGFGRAQPANAAVDCADSDWSVETEDELNEAIACFNAKTAAGSYTITLTQNINLTNSTAAISNNSMDGVELLLEGDGHWVTGPLGGGVRPFNIDSDSTVTIQNITISGGNMPAAFGGGILNSGTLTVVNSTIQDSTAAYGGGILNQGTATVVDSTLHNNTADNSGGGIGNCSNCTLEVIGSTFSNNSANFGGGITNSGTITITNSTVSGNMASDDGGGIYNTADSLDIDSSTVSDNTAADKGGGIYLFGGALTLKNSIVANSGGGGDCQAQTVDDVTGDHNLIEDAANACGLTNGDDGNIVGQDPKLGPLQDNGGPTWTHALLAGSPVIDAGSTTLTTDQRGVTRPQTSAPDIGAFEAMDCTGASWSVTTAGDLAAAIACFNAKTAAGSYTITLTQNINLTNSPTAIGNSVDGVELRLEGNGFVVDGQGFSGVRPFTVESDANVTIQNITITGGNFGDEGGGIFVAAGGDLSLVDSTVSNNRARDGGGIANYGTTLVINSTIHDNFASGNGGGIENQGQMTVINSTVSGNTAQGAGGGLRNFDAALSIYNSTINGNDGGGVYSTDSVISSAVLTIRNNIVANNGGGDCVLAGGTLSDSGYNLIMDDGANACGLNDGDNGNIIGQDPKLGPLQDNGGPTLTHALLAGSPAIDAGSATWDTDQRGVARPQNAADDIGAFEWTPLKLFLPMVTR